MDKLEVGMYVRTKNGSISKIGTIWEDEKIFFENSIDIDYITSDNFGISWMKEENIKASYNILDLINPGDYVNGMEVIAIDSDRRLYVSIDLGQPYDRNFENGCFEYTLLDRDNFEIKSIVTKEQFESVSYKVGE